MSKYWSESINKVILLYFNTADPENREQEKYCWILLCIGKAKKKKR
jgi:hypothetical protein